MGRVRARPTLHARKKLSRQAFSTPPCSPHASTSQLPTIEVGCRAKRPGRSARCRTWRLPSVLSADPRPQTPASSSRIAPPSRCLTRRPIPRRNPRVVSTLFGRPPRETQAAFGVCSPTCSALVAPARRRRTPERVVDAEQHGRLPLSLSASAVTENQRLCHQTMFQRH